MPVIDVTTDPDNLTMTLVAEFAAPPERVWNAYTDPRQLNRFWGPPTWPATFTEFDLAVGGHARYHMVGPRGERSAGAWEFLRIDAGRAFEVLDSFVDEGGTPIEGMPSMRMTFAFEATPTGTRLTSVTYFTSADALAQVVEMGAVEGSTMATNQLDAVLIDLRDYAAGRGTEVELLADTLIRITRVIRGPRELVWRAHTEAALIEAWMLGPDGWRMTRCEVDPTPGASYCYGWEPVGDTAGEAFGFEGETLLVDHPRRIVTTERMVGMEGPETINDLSLYEEDGTTLLTLVIGYPDVETRDAVLATGMVEGMEASYVRLEGVLQAV